MSCAPYALGCTAIHNSAEGHRVNPIQAAALVAKDFPGGIAALARRLTKKNPTTLAHELKPPVGSLAKLGLMTAVEMTEAANDDRILFAWAVSRGYACVRLQVPQQDSPGTLLTDYARFMRDLSEAGAAASSAVADGKITENEIHLCEREFSLIAPAAISLATRMRSVAMQQAKERATPPWKRAQRAEAVAMN